MEQTKNLDGRFAALHHRVTLSQLRIAILNLKVALTQKEPFDFVSKAAAGRTLLVGEGNLSFALSLTRRIGRHASNIVATTFESKRKVSNDTVINAKELEQFGSKVVFGLDATRLHSYFARASADTIIFQFPNVGSRIPIFGRNPNHILARKFLRSGLSVMSKQGQMVITAVDSPYYDGLFHMNEAAQWAGLAKPEVHPFDMNDHPGYSHVNTVNENISAISDKLKFQTFVFNRKDQR